MKPPTILRVLLGNVAVVTISPTDPATGEAVTDGAVAASVTHEDGEALTPAPSATPNDDGTYTVAFEPDRAGEWVLRVDVDGSRKGAAEGLVYVGASGVPAPPVL